MLSTLLNTLYFLQQPTEMFETVFLVKCSLLNTAGEILLLMFLLPLKLMLSGVNIAVGAR